ncbi:MAG TPA: ATP-binding cassette domain-containing protein [Chthoniobacteraceae bacterium]|nr:ATP-binding cassette domain-containing protein [Chthoniobacteraceae bacterium]
MLELQDLSLLIPGKETETVLLGDITSRIPNGHFVAIVGPSGCGKSTLLKLIAGLAEPTFGSVRWEGRDLASDGDFEPYEIGYTPQFSIAYELLTVEENLAGALRLRLGGLTRSERRERVEATLQQVGLHEIADRQVRVLSGGQRRRLALGLELLTSPSLLLCDEVTSGLDPQAEDEMVTLLRSLTAGGKRTVLSVTHSLTHLALYDTVMVLCGGQLAYHGPPALLTHYFQVCEPGELYPQLAKQKPAAWHRSWAKHSKAYLEMSAPQREKKKPEPTDMALLSFPDKSELEASRMPEVEPPPPFEEKKPPADAPEPAPASKADKEGKEPPEDPAEHAAPAEPPREGRFTPSPVSQFFTLLFRRWTLFFRDTSGLWLQLALIAGFPCLVVLFALDGLPQIQNLSLHLPGNLVETMKENAEFAMQASRVGSLVSGLVMFQVILLTLVASSNSAREIASERLIFEKEKFGGLHPGAYVASKVAFLLVLVLVQSLWMGIFVKTICGFPGDPLPQFAVLFMVNAAMTALCLGISSFARTAEQASLISIYFVGFQLPLSGAVLALPTVLGWMTRPFIAAYWGWSGYLQTLRETRFYDVVQSISQTSLSPGVLCFWVLASHVVIGIFIAVIGCRNSRWPQ